MRSAAINVVVQTYLIVGDAETLYKHLGQIPPKDKSLIEEKVWHLSLQNVFFLLVYLNLGFFTDQESQANGIDQRFHLGNHL